MQSIAEILSKILSADDYHGFILTIGVIVAMMSIRTSRILARKKQTADMIFASSRDSELLKDVRKIADLHAATDDNIRKYADTKMSNTDECKTIWYVLNHYEYVSVCVQAEIYDEEMLRRSWCGTVLNLYKHTRDFVDETRKSYQRPTAWQEFQWLAKRWQDKPMKEHNGKPQRFSLLNR